MSFTANGFPTTRNAPNSRARPAISGVPNAVIRIIGAAGANPLSVASSVKSFESGSRKSSSTASNGDDPSPIGEQRAATVARFNDVVSPRFERLDQGPSNKRLVVDHKHPACCGFFRQLCKIPHPCNHTVLA
jgi:hypothetical protein